MNRTTIIIALVGVLLGGLAIGGASGYLDYVERGTFVREVHDGTCATLSAYVDNDLDAAIDARAREDSIPLSLTWAEYVRQREAQEDDISEEERALAADSFRPAVDAAARCTRAASIVGIRNGTVVLILGGLAILGIARIRPARRD